MYLDSPSPLQAQVGYVELGLHGNLGYDHKRVSVKQHAYAFSADLLGVRIAHYA